mgnify:CR=1 FL=1
MTGGFPGPQRAAVESQNLAGFGCQAVGRPKTFHLSANHTPFPPGTISVQQSGLDPLLQDTFFSGPSGKQRLGKTVEWSGFAVVPHPMNLSPALFDVVRLDDDGGQ